MHTEFWSESLKGRDNSEDQGMDGRMTLAWILGKLGRRVKVLTCQELGAPQ